MVALSANDDGEFWTISQKMLFEAFFDVLDLFLPDDIELSLKAVLSFS